MFLPGQMLRSVVEWSLVRSLYLTEQWKSSRGAEFRLDLQIFDKPFLGKPCPDCSQNAIQEMFHNYERMRVTCTFHLIRIKAVERAWFVLRTVFDLVCNLRLNFCPVCRPRAPVWELEDEGIQPDITSDKGKSSNDNRTSMTSTASTFSYGEAACVCLCQYVCVCVCV